VINGLVRGTQENLELLWRSIRPSRFWKPGRGQNSMIVSMAIEDDTGVPCRAPLLVVKGEETSGISFQSSSATVPFILGCSWTILFNGAKSRLDSPNPRLLSPLIG
jgi:hypothetical protein